MVEHEKKDNSYYIEIPAEAATSLNLKDEEVLSFSLTPDGAALKKHSSTKNTIVPLKGVLLATLLVFVAFIAIFRGYHQIPLTGNKSIATLVILFGSFTGMVNFSVHFTKGKRSQSTIGSQQIFWRNFPTVLIAYAFLSFVLLLILFKVLGQFFYGASFDIYTSTAIGTLIVGVVNYAMIYIAQTLTPSKLIRTLIFIILGGVTVAIITNRDQQWWIYNLSFLGTPEASNSWQFNLTLMFSAFLMIALIDYIFVLLYEIEGKTKNLFVLKILLILTAISLGGVGFFPYNENPFFQAMHNRMAGYLVYLFLIIIVLIKWLLPKVSKQFLIMSYSIGLGLLLMVVLFQGVNYLSLTAFELLAFVIAFSWLLLLLQNLVTTVMNHGKEFKVIVRQNQ